MAVADWATDTHVQRTAVDPARREVRSQLSTSLDENTSP